jgi:hypothetical protein
MEEEKFWMVWNPKGRAPTYRHHSKASAQEEAERLAAMHTDTSFYVLKAVSGVRAKKPDLERIELNATAMPF